MGAEVFPREPIPWGDRTAMAFKVHCACDGCESVEYLRICRTDIRFSDPTNVSKRFKRMGWTLGRDRDDDMCPTCSGVGRSKKPEEPVSQRPIIQTSAALPLPSLPNFTPDEEQARILNISPTREDRRRIMAELHHRYDPDAQRYRGGASDKLIATDLAVPKAWIAEVREDFFGPDKNEADAQRQAAIERLVVRCNELDTAIERAMEDVAAVRAELDKLRGA